MHMNPTAANAFWVACSPESVPLGMVNQLYPLQQPLLPVPSLSQHLITAERLKAEPYVQKQRRQEYRMSQVLLDLEEQACGKAVLGDQEIFNRNQNQYLSANKKFIAKMGLRASVFLAHLAGWMRRKHTRYGARASEYDTLERLGRPLEYSISTMQRALRDCEEAGWIRVRRERKHLRIFVLKPVLFKEPDPGDVLYSPRHLARHLGFYEGVILNIFYAYTVGHEGAEFLDPIVPGTGYVTQVRLLAQRLGITPKDLRRRLNRLRSLGILQVDPVKDREDMWRFRIHEPWVSLMPAGTHPLALEAALGPLPPQETKKTQSVDKVPALASRSPQKAAQGEVTNPTSEGFAFPSPIPGAAF